MNDLFQQLIDLGSQYQQQIAWLTGLGFLLALISMVAIPWWLTQIPAHYFSRPYQHPSPASIWQWTIHIARNLIACIIIFAGILMLVLPGQGLITILLGISLSTFPGKYRLERRVVQNENIFRGINWIRTHYGRPPLIYPE